MWPTSIFIFLRMFYRFNGIEGHLKASGQKFLSIRNVDVSIDWRELFRGRILTKVEVDNGSVIVSDALFKETETVLASKQTAEKVRDTMFPVDVSAVYLNECDVRAGALVGAPDSELWRVSKLEGAIRNIMPTPKQPLTLFEVSGEVMKEATLKAFGRLKRLEQPMDWQVRAELRQFSLAKANPLLTKYLPLSFKQGSLTLFTQATSRDGKAAGYVKPFLKDVELMGDKKDFKTVKHFGVEVLGELANAIVRKSDDKTVATKVEFNNNNGRFQVKTDKAVGKAIDHGFGKPLVEGFDKVEVLN
jgi:hypothetical protein